MGFRAVLRVGALMLLIRTWLADSDKTRPTRNFKFSRVPEEFLDVFSCKNCANHSLVHKILDRVLSNYDVRLRPNFGGDPVTVKVSIYVSNIHEISDMNMDYTMTMYFYQTWKDSRLAYSETDLNLTLDYRIHENLWVPDCYFLNSKDTFMQDATVQNRVFQLQPDGTVRYGIRLTTTAACSLDLRKFPMDQQTCKLEVESYGYTVEDIILSWEDDECGVQMTEELNIPQFNFVGKIITKKEVYFYTGSYMRLVLKFQVQRDISSYLLHIYWPTILTTILSWISFWISHDCSAARVTIGLTSILILTTIDSHLRDKLPHIAYVKAIDIYIFVCLLFVFLSLMEYVYINYLFFNQGPRRHRRRRRRARRVLARYLYHDVVHLKLQRFKRRWLCLSKRSTVTLPVLMRKAPSLSLPPVHSHLGDKELTSPPITSSKDGLVNVENEVGSGSLPTRPAQARLVSPESVGSLATVSEQVPLATSESLSTLVSPSTSQQALPGFNDVTVPTDTHIHTKVHVCVEIHDNKEDAAEDNSGLDESHGRGPSGRPMLSHGQKCVQEAEWDFDKIESLQDDVGVKSSSLDLEEQREDDADNIQSIDEENPVTSEQEDSGTESEDDCPLSCGCYCSEAISSKLFNPDHVPKIDRWCRVLFPVAFLLFNIVYWLYHIY